MSARRSVLAEVSNDGFVVGVRFLSDAVRQWDSWTLGERAVAVASVAHDRYLANQASAERSYPTPESVAAAERKLNF
jgi:hypothetical protein